MKLNMITLIFFKETNGKTGKYDAIQKKNCKITTTWYKREEGIICELWKSKSSFNENTRKEVRHKNRTKSRKDGKQMKNILRGITFWTIALAFILIMFGLAELLTKIVTMNLVMTVVYIALGFSFIYIFKNL